jgi:hypothetical protein
MKHYGACTATKPAPPVPMKVVTADVSALGAAAQDRHLYVNGARARRARLPVDVAATLFKGAKLTADGFTLGAPGKSTSIHPVGCDSQKKVFSDRWLTFAAAVLLQTGAEFVFPQSTSPWTEPRCAVSSSNATHISMMQPCWIDLVHKACGQRVKGPPVGRTGCESCLTSYEPLNLWLEPVNLWLMEILLRNYRRGERGSRVRSRPWRLRSGQISKDCPLVSPLHNPPFLVILVKFDRLRVNAVRCVRARMPAR